MCIIHCLLLPLFPACRTSSAAASSAPLPPVPAAAQCLLPGVPVEGDWSPRKGRPGKGRAIVDMPAMTLYIGAILQNIVLCVTLEY